MLPFGKQQEIVNRRFYKASVVRLALSSSMLKLDAFSVCQQRSPIRIATMCWDQCGKRVARGYNWRQKRYRLEEWEQRQT